MNYLREQIRGIVYHSGAIVFILDDLAHSPDVQMEEGLDASRPRLFYPPLSREEHSHFRDQCMRDRRVYDFERKLPSLRPGKCGLHSEHDFPLTPERPVGRIEGVSDPSPDSAERACPRDPDTSGSET